MIDSLYKQAVDQRDYTKFLLYAEKKLSQLSAAEDKGELLSKMADANYHSSQYKKVETQLLAALKYFEEAYPATHYKIGRSHNYLGIFYSEIGRLEAAEKHYLASSSIALKGGKMVNYAASLQNLALFYANQGALRKAEEHYQKALRITKEELGENSANYSRILSNLGSFYAETNQYSLAQAAYLKAIDILPKVEGLEAINRKMRKADLLKKMGYLHLNMGAISQAEEEAQMSKQSCIEVYEEGAFICNEYLQLEIKLLEYRKNYSLAEKKIIQLLAGIKNEIGTKNKLYFSNLLRLGNNQLAQKKWASLEESLQQLNTLEQQLELGPYETLNRLRLVLSYELAMGQKEKAEKLAQQALDKSEKQFGKEHALSLHLLNKLGQIALSRGQQEKALSYFEQAIAANSNQKREEIQLDAPLSYLDFQLLLESFRGSYQCQLAAKQKHQLISLAIKLLLQQQHALQEEKDRLALLKESANWLEKGLSSTASLNIKYKWIQQNKAVLLRNSLGQSNQRSLGLLSKQLQDKEDQLHKAEQNIRKKLLLKEGDPKLIRKELQNIFQEQLRFQQLLQDSAADYLALRYQQHIYSLEELQQSLSPQMAAIEYVWGDSIVYLLYVDSETAQLLRLSNDPRQLEKQVYTFLGLLSNYKQLELGEPELLGPFVQQSSALYERLLAPLSSLLPSNKKLLIIPDGPLLQLPFEALLNRPAGKKRFGDLPYLIKDKAIFYHYSSSLFLEQQKDRPKKGGQMLAIAGSYTEGQGRKLESLPKTRLEIGRLARQFEGRFLLDSLATEANFKANIKRYAVIHLAMHGIQDKAEPLRSGLAFSNVPQKEEDNLLMANEIMNLPISADLVVLSACETAVGRFQQGNATASLARAFMYAGTPAALVSLWQVNDESTAILMEDYYRQIAAGADKSSALQRAKLKYLSANKNSIAAHPIFWAAFVQIGIDQPLYLAEKTMGNALLFLASIFAGGIGLLLILSVIFRWRRHADAEGIYRK